MIMDVMYVWGWKDLECEGCDWVGCELLLFSDVFVIFVYMVIIVVILLYCDECSWGIYSDGILLFLCFILLFWLISYCVF